MHETHGERRLAGELSNLSDHTEFIKPNQLINDYVTTWQQDDQANRGFNHNDA